MGNNRTNPEPALNPSPTGVYDERLKGFEPSTFSLGSPLQVGHADGGRADASSALARGCERGAELGASAAAAPASELETAPGEFLRGSEYPRGIQPLGGLAPRLRAAEDALLFWGVACLLGLFAWLVTGELLELGAWWGVYP